MHDWTSFHIINIKVLFVSGNPSTRPCFTGAPTTQACHECHLGAQCAALAGHLCIGSHPSSHSQNPKDSTNSLIGRRRRRQHASRKDASTRYQRDLQHQGIKRLLRHSADRDQRGNRRMLSVSWRMRSGRRAKNGRRARRWRTKNGRRA